MPFLSRRPVDPFTSLSPLKDRGYPSKLSDLSQNPRIRAQSEASLLKRVSTLFTGRRRWSSKASYSPTNSPSNSSSVGIGYIHPCPWHTLSRVSSDSTPHSSLEIRRPSGLGRRASLLFSDSDSIADSESYGKVLDGGDTAPTGFASLPNLLGGAAYYAPGIPYPPELPAPKYTASFALSDSIFRDVLGYLARDDLSAVALVSRGFCSAARYALYHSLDLQNMTESSLEKLFYVLASREELAALVASFCCQSSLRDLTSTASALSSVPSGDIRQAFQNMYNLKSLTLPSFVSILSHTPSFTFSLTHLTILDKRMTQSQLVALRSWLATQPSLEWLSFPHLSEFPSADTSIVDEWVPLPDPNDHCSFTTILPALKSLHAPAEVVSALCFAMSNPIQHLTLCVHGTLYTGLRPGSVVRALNGVHDMHIVFSPDVDKRTVEKFLGVTGSMLTGNNKAEAMKSLEVEVQWTDSDAAETLYGIVTSIISRFRGLETLKLTSPFRSIQAPIPKSIGVLPYCPPTFSLPSPRPAAMTTRPAKHPFGTTRKEFVTCIVEQHYAKTWTKSCPSLSDIQFDFSCSTTDAEVELCGVWFRRKMPILPASVA